MLGFDVSALAGLRKSCACGREHIVPIRTIVTGTGVLPRLREVLREFHGKQVFLVGDNHTMPLAEEEVRGMLAAAGCTVQSHVFRREGHLILDEALIGAMLVRMPSETDLIIAIGSGTMNDLCRVISARCHIPYAIIATAPSMDGYASAVSPVVMEGGKHSVRLCVPHAILADTALLKTAPQVMLSSGVGDILGKYVAIRDWQLARREQNEYYCEHIAGMVADAASRCVAGISGVCSREESALRDMADTLIMSGAAIAMHGESSRPASGCEHQLAHYWEVALLSGDRESPLHGNLVGLGTQIACRLYQLAGAEFDLDFPGNLPAAEEIAGLMARLGDYATARVLGVTRELFYDSFFHATEANGRYTLITYLTERGRLEHYAALLTGEFFS